MSYFSYLYLIFLLSSFTGINEPPIIVRDIPIIKTSAENDKNEFKPNQLVINYIYSRSLDIIMRYPGVFLGKNEIPLFNSEIDTVFVSAVLTNDCNYREVLLDSQNIDIRKIDCQYYFNNLSFQNTFNLYIKDYVQHYDNPENPNISINFSHLFQYKDKILIGAHIFWNTKKRGININQNDLVIEMKLCYNNFILFKKLYANIFTIDKVYLVKLQDPQNSKVEKQKEIPNKSNFKKIKGKYFDTIFDEYDLPDKNCDE